MVIFNIDDAILDRLQIVADYIHDITGLDCIVQARVFYVISAVGMVAVMCQDKNIDWNLAIAIVASLQRGFFENDHDKIARSAGFRNPRRIHPMNRIVRCLISWTSLLVLVGSLFRGQSLLIVTTCTMWAAVYFECCDVQSPRLGRIRDFLRSLGRKPVMVPTI